MNKTIVFIDLDGVLCDFVGPVMQLFGKTPDYAIWPKGKRQVHEILGVEKDELWLRIARAGRQFWENLPETPEFRPILNIINSANVPWCIVTSPSKSPACAAGKVAWMKKRFGRRFEDFFLCAHKYLLAAPSRLLIDDWDANTTAFENAGGAALLWPQQWNWGTGDGLAALKTALRRPQNQPNKTPSLRHANV